MINLELPALVAKVLLVLPYVGWDNVKPSELNICTVGQKVLHPIHVVTGRIKQTKHMIHWSKILMPNIFSPNNILGQGLLQLLHHLIQHHFHPDRLPELTPGPTLGYI